MATHYDTLEMPTIQLPRIREGWTARTWWVAFSHAAVTSVLSIALHLWVLLVLAPPGSPGLWSRVMSWDADLYRQVAQNGYPSGLTYDPHTHALQGSNLAFSPLYPLLERLFHTLGSSWTGAAMAISWPTTVLCLTLVYKLADDLYGRAAALPAVVLVGCAQPMALVFALGYPDGGLYLSIALAAVLMARSKRWMWAGAFAALAGVTRPTGVAVTVTVAMMALAAWKESSKDDQRFSVAGTILGCVGTPAYLLWVGLHTGRADAWFAVQQAGWGTHWDWGASFWNFLTGDALHANGLEPMVDIVTAIGVLGYAWASIHAARRSELWAMAAMPLTVLVLTVGQSNYTCVKLRLLLAASLCLLPLAQRIGEWSTSARWTLLVASTLLSAWWGSVMLNVWHWAL